MNLQSQAQTLRQHLQSIPSPRPLHIIAAEINTHYADALRKGKVPAWVAWSKPYQQAMRELDSIDQRYYFDSAYEIVLRCLCNLQSWRGADAKRIKAELQMHLDACPEDKHL